MKKTVNKIKLVMPTDDEDARINAGIAADPDTYELSAEEFKKLRPRRGRPVSKITKEQVTIRLDHDILDMFRSQGRGWQSRINAVLREYKNQQDAVSQQTKVSKWKKQIIGTTVKSVFIIPTGHLTAGPSVDKQPWQISVSPVHRLFGTDYKYIDLDTIQKDII